MNDLVQVELEDGTIGRPIRFLVGDIPFESEKDAIEYISKMKLEKIEAWFNNHSSVVYEMQSLIKGLSKTNKDDILELARLLQDFSKTL